MTLNRVYAGRSHLSGAGPDKFVRQVPGQNSGMPLFVLLLSATAALLGILIRNVRVAAGNFPVSRLPKD